VQIAKAMGAEVTGVCSTKNVELLRSIGADHVIDYTREDFTAGAQRYDLIIDNVATHSVFEYRRVLNPNGVYVMIGAANLGNWFGFMVNPIEGWLVAPFGKQSFGMMGAHLAREDLLQLAVLMQSGKVTPVLDRRYPLSDAAEALRYVEKGHARGKVVLTVE
jgi:NADPH:quinone reductase-like Zn-dependent oxidoreductase